jgi:hypothetical protein
VDIELFGKPVKGSTNFSEFKEGDSVTVLQPDLLGEAGTYEVMRLEGGRWVSIESGKIADLAEDERVTWQ